jgi:hypothetical protein
MTSPPSESAAPRAKIGAASAGMTGARAWNSSAPVSLAIEESTMFRLELKETTRGRQICESTPRYDVVVNGAVTGQLYFNMRGYVGTLPTHSGAKLLIGERGISAYRSEVRRINRDARAAAA